MANNIFTNQLNNRELMDAFGIQQDNAPLTPEELVALSEQQQAPVIEEPIEPAEPAVPTITPPVVKAVSTTPKQELQQAPTALTEDLPKAPATETPMSKSEALMAEYNKLLGKGQEDLAEARSRDRMLKVGGALGDALATYINAQSQKNVKAPGVQVQQGAGLGKIADMFATSPEIASDVAARREAMLKQYAELARGERSQARLKSEEERSRAADLRARELAQMQIEGNLKAAGIRAGARGTEKPLTPYQEYMIGKSEKKEAKLSDKQTAELEGLGNVMRSLDEVEAAKSGVNTGRYASALQSGKEALPFSEADQDFVKLRQLSGTQLFDYVKAQSGVSYSVKELEQLKQNMPNVDDDDNTFVTKLNTVRDIIKRKQEEKVKALQGQGKDISGFEKQTSAKKASAGDVVTVKGKKYRVAEDGDSLIPIGK
jgi:hypothetical protein